MASLLLFCLCWRTPLRYDTPPPPPLVCGECSAMVFWLIRGLESGSTRPEGKVWNYLCSNLLAMDDKTQSLLCEFSSHVVCLYTDESNENEILHIGAFESVRGVEM